MNRIERERLGHLPRPKKVKNLVGTFWQLVASGEIFEITHANVENSIWGFYHMAKCVRAQNAFGFRQGDTIRMSRIDKITGQPLPHWWRRVEKP